MSYGLTPKGESSDNRISSEIDLVSAQQNEIQRSLEKNLARLPKLRLWVAVGALVVTLLHNRRAPYDQWAGGPSGLLIFSFVFLAYSVVAWRLLLRYKKGHKTFHSVGTALLALDVVFIAWAIYLTGGESSWLILLLPMRTADQMAAGFRRCLLFAHWTLAAYLGVLSWIQLIDGRDLAWSTEIGKLLLLYAVNLYLAWTARFIDQRRRLTLDWVALSRKLILDLEKQTDELESARVKAQVASRAKSQFLANMSHELRTPMNAVMGLADLLALHRLDKKQRERANLLRESAADLQAVIDNLLDFSQIEAEELTLEPTECDVVKVAQGVLKRLHGRAELKGIELETFFDAALPARLLLDPLRIRQVLLHLTDNAIKFTEEGRVAVRARAIDDPDDPERLTLRLEIEDTGLGIAQREIPRLFEPFTQKDESLTRRQGGTGLGLPICKRLVDMMDGEIGVRSRLGRGSTFWVTIPTRRLPEDDYEHLPSNDTLDVEKARVLVVEDNPVNQEVIVSMLSGLGFRVAKANHGGEALEILEQERFDLVLMDCQMPTMDGYRATEEIRRREGDGRHTPIVAVTAHAMEGDRERCLAAGMDDYLPKPLSLESLGSTLARWIDL